VTAPEKAPLQLRAESLLQTFRSLKRRPRRGDVEAELQRAIYEALEEIAEEMCGDCGHCRDEHYTSDDEEDGCGARPMWKAWQRVRDRLWGRLGRTA
jgi:hypothetical protein